MTDIHIPPAALEAGARALYEKWCELHGVADTSLPWEEVYGDERDYCIAEARAAFLAIVENWEGMGHYPGAKVTKTWRDPGKIILPLPPQENSDAE